MIYSAPIKRMKKANKNLKCFKVCPRLYHHERWGKGILQMPYSKTILAKLLCNEAVRFTSIWKFICCRLCHSTFCLSWFAGTLKGNYLLHHVHHYQHERNKTVLIHSKNANNFTKAVLPQHWSTHVVDSKDWNSLKDLVHNFLESNTDVLFYSQQVVRQRFVKLILINLILFDDILKNDVG